MSIFGHHRRQRLVALGLILLVAAVAVIVRIETPLAPSPAGAAAPETSPRSVANSPPTTAQLIGIDRIEARLGSKTPTGRGIIFGHVEGGPPNQYMPEATSERFRGVMMLPVSGESTVSGHAQTTALILYGQGGLAPGVSRVLCFSAGHWMDGGCLHGGSDKPPAAGHIRIFTNSWIGNAANGTAEVLCRMDYLIDEDDVIIVAGVNNGHGTPVPPLLASSYNAISVGNWDGQSSGGYTQFDGPGRCKPDLVAPQGLTSFATPVVAACAARLLEVCDRGGPHNPAAHSEVIKALLMAGADKPPEWKSEPGKPLDTYLGAGRVRFDHSYDILDAGPSAPGTVRSRYGWAFQSMARTATHAYLFDSSHALGEASIMLVWNRRIQAKTGRNIFTDELRWYGVPRLADFDLKLTRLDDGGQPTVVGVSANKIDNVEHLYFRDLPRGRYRIEVTRKDSLDEDWDYALAWRIENPTLTEGQARAGGR